MDFSLTQEKEIHYIMKVTLKFKPLRQLTLLTFTAM
jgi:hypothetical protein